MKTKIVKMTKGNSLVYVKIGEIADGNGYSVALGGNCGIHDHETKDAAEAEFRARIGRLVENGYKAELYKQAEGAK